MELRLDVIVPIIRQRKQAQKEVFESFGTLWRIG